MRSGQRKGVPAATSSESGAGGRTYHWNDSGAKWPPSMKGTNSASAVAPATSAPAHAWRQRGARASTATPRTPQVSNPADRADEQPGGPRPATASLGRGEDPDERDDGVSGMSDRVADPRHAGGDGQEPDATQQDGALHPDEARRGHHEEPCPNRDDECERNGRTADRAVEQELQRAGLNVGQGVRAAPVGGQECAPDPEEHGRVAAEDESLVERDDRSSRNRHRPREAVPSSPNCPARRCRTAS